MTASSAELSVPLEGVVRRLEQRCRSRGEDCQE